MQLYKYNEIEYQLFTSTNVEELLSNIDLNQNNWLNFEHKLTKEFIDLFSSKIKIHPLIQEDLILKEDSAKIEFYEDHLFVTLEMMTLKKPGLVIKENVSFILMKNTLFTFQEGIEGDVFDDIRNRISSNTGKVRRSPIDYLLWRLLDIMVKQYFKVFESYRTEVEIIEDNLIYNHTKIQISEIIQIKREINEIRKLVLPLKNGLSLIKQESNHLIHKNTIMYFKDLLDQLNNLENSIITSRELIKDVIELENANQTQTMNQIMKLLTIMSSIFIPLTFLVGVYGMNFDNMPELHYRYGYHVLWVTMIGIGFSLWYFFRRKNWL